MQAYSNPERESDVYALPDVEVFYFDKNAGYRLDDLDAGADVRDSGPGGG